MSLTQQHFRVRAAALLVAVTAAMSACSAASTTSTTTTMPTTTSPAPAAAEPTVTIESGWAKAGEGMTAVFGRVHNPGPDPVTITGGSSPEAGEVQVHSMAKQPDGTMKMVQKDGGLLVPPGGDAVLAPGGDHIMLLDLAAPLVNGSTVRLLMTTNRGAILPWSVPVRSFAGAEETYAPGGLTTAPTP